MSTTSFIINIYTNEGEVINIHTNEAIQYVIIICNDVTRAYLDEIGQNLLTRHFLASSTCVIQ